MSATGSLLTDAGLLAAWGTAVLQGRSRPEELTSVLHSYRDDVVFLDLPGKPGRSDVAGALGTLARRGATVLRVVAAAPGDVSDLSGPPSLTAAAALSGAAVVSDGDPGIALVPTLDTRGPATDRWSAVEWRALTAAGHVVPEGAGEADRDLTRALHDVVAALERLDVARFQADLVASVRAADHGARLPAGTPPRAVSLLHRAAQVEQIARAGLTDPGSAVTGWESQRREAALRSLLRQARRAQAAAWNDAARGTGPVAAARRGRR